jgi:hypothetical protein
MRPVRLIARGRTPWLQDACYGFYKRWNRKNSFDRLFMSGSGLARSIYRSHQQCQIARRRLDE